MHILINGGRKLQIQNDSDTKFLDEVISFMGLKSDKNSCKLDVLEISETRLIIKDASVRQS